MKGDIAELRRRLRNTVCSNPACQCRLSEAAKQLTAQIAFAEVE